ncbi:MAG: hypothetical protein EOP14_00065 [Pseudomonas sp.]|nr:MAG: hypothetical protein EOP14_00065 [Pseudomonas sp.]
MNESLKCELTHLVNLCAEPYREVWAAYVWAKAKGLARHDPETYSDLPRLLTQALRPPPCDKGIPTTGEVLR